MAEYKAQGKDIVFALDIGTRSIVGVVGKAENGRLNVLDIEVAEHAQRTMIDGQIDNIQQVGALAKEVTKRLEDRLGIQLQRVCVAAAGRALRTQKGTFSMKLIEGRPITAEQVSHLEAGAVSEAEERLQTEGESNRQFFLVGYTVAQYRLDGYPMSVLRDHSGSMAEADIVATFLPAEVVESLYSAMRAAGLQISGMTLEPIAAMNAAIPAELRLLNLALVDIGAGTTDIAICKDGSIVGYTMATIAGDEITEAIMRELLVDFRTAEEIKRSLLDGRDIRYTDILGQDEVRSYEDLCQIIQEPMERLAQAVCEQVVSVNSTAPSAVFLAGGGSKLDGLRSKVAKFLQMDEKRVAIAGNNFAKSAFSEKMQLDNPEYATPLGIAVSVALGLLHDSYTVTLNGHDAKLFRSGALTLRDVLLMNGYTYADMVGRSGKNLSITVDGRHTLFRGEPSAPAILKLNDEEAPISAPVHAGDRIQFTPARYGADAHKTLGDLLGQDFNGLAYVNNQEVPLDTPLQQGDSVLILKKSVKVPEPVVQPEPEPVPEPEPQPEPEPEPQPEPEPEPEPVPAAKPIRVILNDRSVVLPGKEDGAPYYLMDLLQHTDLDFDNLDRPVRMTVNGQDGSFLREVKDGDTVTICCI